MRSRSAVCNGRIVITTCLYYITPPWYLRVAFSPSGRSEMTTDDRELFEELVDDEEFASGLSRADVLKRGAAASAALWGVSSLFGAETAFGSTQARSLTPTFYQWIYGLYPDIPKGINK